MKKKKFDVNKYAKPVKREGIETIAVFEPTNKVVGICNFKNRIIIATESGVYVYPAQWGVRK